MEASDSAFGVLQLSASAVSVDEHYVGPIINVTRTRGIFADVSVKFRAVPLTARVSKCRTPSELHVSRQATSTSKCVCVIS